MKFDFDTPILGPEGLPIPMRAQRHDPKTGLPTEDASEVPSLTLGRCALAACVTAMEGDGAAEGLAYELYRIAGIVRLGDVQEITARQIEILKRRIERQFSPWVVGVCWDLLEQKAAAAEPTE